MTDDGRELAAESWAFALKLYAEPGVSDACLKLQADTGVDVMMLLVVTFAAAQRRILGDLEQRGIKRRSQTSRENQP